MNEQLAERNTVLSQAFFFRENPNPGLMLETKRIEIVRGKPKAISVFPSYCPFCGEKYPKKEEQAS
ncbi:hypothetical protein [Cohaesibacter sp. ES.047]|uniref:hypothetical protein n=1 Tax=Cohaesibacter sp. ES.047 TaxID=1798205 RepID=UPI001FCE3AAA|nr:hypothetical protein [Cohaesibacter sp. ES.047]